MNYIDFCGYSISKLSLGTVQFGLDYGIANSSGKPTLEDANKIVKYLVQNGVNCFDTANGYGDSEKVLGKIFDDIDINPIVVSKLESNLFITDFETTINKSLKDLHLSTLFGLLLHDAAILYHWSDEYIQKIQQVKTDNLIKYFGISIYTDEEFNLAINNPSIDIIQIPFNIFDQRAIKLEWIKKAKKSNKLLFIRSVYLQGLLLMDIDAIPAYLKNAQRYIEEFSLLAKQLNMSKNKLCLSFVNSMAKDSIILFGCDNITQAKENLLIFNNLKDIDMKVFDSFSNVPEDIYNPAKWNI